MDIYSSTEYKRFSSILTYIISYVLVYFLRVEGHLEVHLHARCDVSLHWMNGEVGLETCNIPAEPKQKINIKSIFYTFLSNFSGLAIWKFSHNNEFVATTFFLCIWSYNWRSAIKISDTSNVKQNIGRNLIIIWAASWQNQQNGICAQRRLRSAWASAPVWSASSLSAWRKLGSLATHWAHSEDWSDWADAQADLCLRWAHNHIVGFVMRRFICAWCHLSYLP